MIMIEIKKLDQSVINQIAAGEVVERPASALKEILENSIDAGSTHIEVFIEEGGLQKIEVRDNGKGISKENLPLAFERYATSKLSAAEELEAIATYGFRGEALAAIAAVSRVTIISKRDNEVWQQVSDFGKLSEAIPAARGVGTTVIIEKLFSNVPARQKFMKSPDTEYKYLLKIFNSFALLNGNIHFTLHNNGKEIYNFPPSNASILPKERVQKIFALQTNDLIAVEHEEYGHRITGYLLHPKSMSGTSKFSQLYINLRSIEDKGVFKAVTQGLSGFVPDFYKPSYILAVNMPQDQIDVNVHPRKTEIKMVNPFRVYAAVTHAVSNALQTQVAEPDRNVVQSNSHQTVFTQPTTALPVWERKEASAYARLRGSQPQFFYDTNSNESDFSAGNDSTPTEDTASKIPEYILSQATLSLSDADIQPILGRYIVVGFLDEVWIVDQHAAAERIRYERFKAIYQGENTLEQQNLLVALSISLTEEELLVCQKHRDIFNRLGFNVDVQDNELIVSAIPIYLQKADIAQLLKDTVRELVEHDDIFLSPVIGDFTTEKSISHIIATMACHNSVRMNERISVLEAKSIMKDLLSCHIPYACPHGRRVVWRLSKEEVDRQFMRT